MKKSFCLLLILCFVFFSGTLRAQSWAWALKGATGPATFVEATCVDASGNTYVAGEFYNTTVFGSFTLTSSDMDIFIAKYDANGVCLWAKPIVLSVAGQEVSDIAVNSAGECFVTGWFMGTATVGTLPVLTSAGGKDIIVAKYNASTGAPIWAKRFGNAYDNINSKLAVDGSGNCYFSGSMCGNSTCSTPATITFGSLSPITGYMFVLKLNNAGTPLWARPGSSTSYVADIRIDGNGGCNVFGAISNALTFGTVTMTPTTGKTAAFLMRFNSTTGASIWGTNTTIGNATGMAMDVDANNDIVISGTCDATTVFTGTTVTSGSGNGPAYIAKYNTSGVVQWAKQIPSTPRVTDLDTDCLSNIYITGNDLGSPMAVYVKKYSTLGSAIWSVPATVSLSDYYYSDFQFVGVDNTGNVYTTGNEATATFGSTTLTATFVNDFYIAKIAFVTPIISGTLICTHSGSTTLTVTNPLPDYTYAWYTSATGGTPLATGPSYTTPVINPGFVPTYYLEATSTTNCQTLSRIPVNITVDNSCCPTVILPTASNATICNNKGTATLTVSNQQSGYSYAWYPTSTSTSALSGVPTYTTPTLTAINTFTYYVQAFNNTGCPSTRVPVSVTVDNSCCPVFITPTVSNVSVCSGKSATFVVTNPQTDYVYTWYTVSSGGTSIATGTSYTSPTLTATTTYYVDASKSTTTCPASSRTAVTATIDNSCCSIANVTMPTTQQNPIMGTDVYYQITVTNPGTSNITINSITSVASTPAMSVTSVDKTFPIVLTPSQSVTIEVLGTYTSFSTGTTPFPKYFSVNINGCVLDASQPTLVLDPLGTGDADFTINSNNVPVRTSQAVNFTGDNSGSTTNSWYVKPAGGSYTLLSGNTNTVSYTFPDLGNYYVKHSYSSYTLTKAVTVTGENRALAFSTAEVNAGTNSSYGIGNFTLEAYIKPTTLPTAANSKACILSNVVSNYGFELGINNSGKLYFYIDGTTYVNSTGTTFSNGTCYHIAITLSGTTYTFYVNGIAEGTFTAGNPSYNEATLFLGRSSFYDGYSYGQYVGLMEDVRIWSVARTQSQLSSNIYMTLIGTETGLLSYWPINEGSGTTIYDLKSTNNGTLSGQTWTTMSCGGMRESDQSSNTNYQQTSDNVSVYPVPFTNETNIIVHSANNESVSIVITDLLGSEVYKVHALNSNTSYTIGKDFTSGIYTVAIRCGEQVEYRKIVKQ